MKFFLKRMVPLLLCLFLLSACGNSMEGLKKQAETEHFIFYSEKEDAESIHLVSDHLEEKYTEFSELFHVTPAEKSSFLMFPNRDAFLEGLKNQGLPDSTLFPDYILGLTFPWNSVYILSPKNLNLEFTQDVVKNIYTHELAHTFVNAINENTPNFLQEGVASYLAGEKELRHVEKTLTLALQSELFPTPREMELMYLNHEDLYPYSCSYIEYIVETYGFEKVLEMVKLTDSPDYIRLFGVTEEAFRNGWMKFVEDTYMQLNFE